MQSKFMTGVAVLALCGATSPVFAQATVQTQTTVEESRSVIEAPKPRAGVKEETTTTTTTKKGLFGRKKETTTSTSRSEREPDALSADSNVRSRTTVETERRTREY